LITNATALCDPLKSEHKELRASFTTNRPRRDHLVEPLATLELNNEWRKLQLEEQKDPAHSGRTVQADWCAGYAIKNNVERWLNLISPLPKAVRRCAACDGTVVAHYWRTNPAVVTNIRQHPGTA